MSEFTPANIGDGKVTSDGKTYFNTADGGLMPVELVRPLDQLKDEVVRKICGHGLALSQQVSRFLGHTFDDIGGLEALMAQEYQMRLGGKKGNITLYTIDGRFKVEVRVQDRIDFGPELQVAKALVDECLIEWSSDARAELRAIVTRAFNTDQTGKINRSEIFTLLRMDIADPRWQQAMRAIRDAMIIIGSKTYVRMWMSDTQAKAWWGEQFVISLFDIREVETREHGRGLWMPHRNLQIEALQNLLTCLFRDVPSLKNLTTHWYISPGRKVDTDARFRIYAGTNPVPVYDVSSGAVSMPNAPARVFGAGMLLTNTTAATTDMANLYYMGLGTVAGFTRARG